MTSDLKAFGVAIRDVIQWHDVGNRDLDVVELWSGVGSVAKAAMKKHLAVSCFDVRDDPSEDLTTLAGFRKALSLVLRLKKGGLLVMGPPCRSFVWMNSSNCKRTEDDGYMGDWSYEAVHEGNVMLDVALFFFTLAVARNATPVLENPLQSNMWKCTPWAVLKLAFEELYMSGLLDHKLHFVTVFRCAYTDPGDTCYFKPFQFVSNHKFVLGLARPCVCTGHARTVTRLDGGRCRGNKTALDESATYPAQLGESFVTKWAQEVAVPKFRRSLQFSPSALAGLDGSESDGDKPFTARRSSWAASGSESEGEHASSSKQKNCRKRAQPVHGKRGRSVKPRLTWAASDSE